MRRGATTFRLIGGGVGGQAAARRSAIHPSKSVIAKIPHDGVDLVAGQLAMFEQRTGNAVDQLGMLVD